MCFRAIRVWMRLIVLAVVPCLLAFAGCGDKGPGSMATGKVKGKVTFNGKTLPSGCKITFTHQEKSFPASGDIGADGSYTVMFNGKPDVPVGTYDVTVAPPPTQQAVTPSPSDPEAYKAVMMGGGAGAKVTANQEVFPAKYQNAQLSQQTCTVLEGQEAVFDLDMKSGG